MKLIIGLGNPEPKHELTRHNVGFLAIDELAKRFDISLSEKSRFEALIGKGRIADEEVILAKPLTYMNQSGRSAQAIASYFGIEADDIWCIYDESTIGFGSIRLRENGSAGGHNGVKSLIEHLGTNTFKRIRIGIGAPPEHLPLADYVLRAFSQEEQTQLAPILSLAVNRIETGLKNGFDTMTEHAEL